MGKQRDQDFMGYTGVGRVQGVGRARPEQKIGRVNGLVRVGQEETEILLV